MATKHVLVSLVCGAFGAAACGADVPNTDSPRGGQTDAAVSAGTSAVAGVSGSLGAASTAGMSVLPAGPASASAGSGASRAAGNGTPAPRPGSSTSGAAGQPAAGPVVPLGPPGTWPAADPAMKGSFATMTESNVGPGMAFTMYRPAMLTQRHPVITWGNGTGTTPPTYRGLLELFASHGFIVIASNSMNVGQGTPPPMLDGVTWVLEQDM
ncbi:MAG: hypothetical protein RL701_1799, partial [Pseudomonadota bacterium]